MGLYIFFRYKDQGKRNADVTSSDSTSSNSVHKDGPDKDGVDKDGTDKKYFLIFASFAVLIVLIALIGSKESNNTDSQATESSGTSSSGASSNSSVSVNENTFLQEIEANPNDDNLHFEYANYLLSEKQYSKALIELDKTVSLNNDRVDAQALSGWVVFLAGLSDQSLERLNKAVEMNADYANTYFFLAMVNRANNNLEESKKFAQKYLDLSADNAEFVEPAKQLVS